MATLWKPEFCRIIWPKLLMWNWSFYLGLLVHSFPNFSCKFISYKVVRTKQSNAVYVTKPSHESWLFSFSRKFDLLGMFYLKILVGELYVWEILFNCILELFSRINHDLSIFLVFSLDADNLLDKKIRSASAKFNKDAAGKRGFSLGVWLLELMFTVTTQGLLAILVATASCLKLKKALKW